MAMGLQAFTPPAMAMPAQTVKKTQWRCHVLSISINNGAGGTRQSNQ
jgi:hypothetical protein